MQYRINYQLLYILSVMLLSACGAGPGLSPPVDLNSESPDLGGEPPAALSPTIADLTGTWRWQGGFCGTDWTAAGHVEDVTFAGNLMTVKLGTGCGMTVVQHYSTVQTDTALSYTLTKSWQPGNPVACPGVLSVVPNGATDVAAYQVTGNQLTMTEGTCAGGVPSITLYQKL